MRYGFACLLSMLFVLAGTSVALAQVPAANDSETTPPAYERPALKWRGIALGDSRVVASEPRRVESLDELLRVSLLRAFEELGQETLTPKTVWGTVIDYRDSRDPRIGSYHGDQPVYPASVVKLCYMATAFDQNRIGLLELDSRMREDLELMIGPSDNAATGRILDRLANTSYGPELQGDGQDSFTHKRQIAHRYMSQLGLDGLWSLNKTYGEGMPFYGREVQFLGDRSGGNYERSNKMTTNDTARLLYLIWRHAIVDYEACEAMLELMRRDEEKRTFFSSIVPKGVTLYSKSGSTSVQRHDAGIFAYPGGGAVMIVLFSNHQNVQNREYPRVIQRAAELVLERLADVPGELDNATADPDPTLAN